jgi:hypothetical protein
VLDDVETTSVGATGSSRCRQARNRLHKFAHELSDLVKEFELRREFDHSSIRKTATQRRREGGRLSDGTRKSALGTPV